MRFSGRRAVVTGGGSGIGLAVVHQLLGEGAAVVAADISRHGLAAAAELGAECVSADVTRKRDRTRVAMRAGEFDYLVNAAGVIRVANMEDINRPQWGKTFAVNAEGLFFTCLELAQHIRDGGGIVNVGSMAAKVGDPPAAVYAASKAAVLSLTRSLAVALARRGIRVNSISPGIIDTPMQDDFLPFYATQAGKSVEEFQADRILRVPLGRIGRPEDCAGVICFLLSDDAGYVTGEDVNVSGGLVTW